MLPLTVCCGLCCGCCAVLSLYATLALVACTILCTACAVLWLVATYLHMCDVMCCTLRYLIHFFCPGPPLSKSGRRRGFCRLQPLVTMAIRTPIHARSRHVRRCHGQIWSGASLLVHPATLRELERFSSTQYRPGWTTFHAALKNPLPGARTTV